MKPAFTIVLILFLALIVLQCDGQMRRDKIRWCKNHVRDCSRKRFSSLIVKKQKAMDSTTSKPMSTSEKPKGGAPKPKPPALKPISSTVLPPSGNRKRREASSDVNPVSDEDSNSMDLLYITGDGEELSQLLRIKRAAEKVSSSTSKPDLPPGNGNKPKPKPKPLGGGGSSTTPNPDNKKSTLPAIKLTTEPPSLPLPPPLIFNTTELEDTFFSCLDDLGVKKCKGFMTQRCNWHNGKSPVIARYCKKWNVPCTPCTSGGKDFFRL